MDYKEFNVKYSDEGNGSIEGYASTWIRTPDSYGDIVKQGAFTKTLEERWNGGKGIPLLWAHQMDNLDAYIGTADAEEDQKGLHFLAYFDGTDEAQRVRELYKDGRLSKFSFAYDTKDAGIVELEDGTKANELRELDLFEISCVCVPANEDAGIVDIKTSVASIPVTTCTMDATSYITQTRPYTGTPLPEGFVASGGWATNPYVTTKTITINPIVEEVKSGRRNSQKDADAIREAIKLLEGVLGQIDEADEPEPEEDEAKANTAVEEPEQSNSERKDRLLEYIDTMENGGSSNDA